MSTFPTLRLVSLAALAAFMLEPALAQGQTYYYGGISVGESETNIEADRITRDALGESTVITDVQRRQREMAYKLFGGYQFSPNFALEGGYYYLGRPHFQASVLPGGTVNGETKVQGWNVDLLGMMPWTDSLSGFARLGLQYGKASANVSGTGSASAVRQSPTEHKLDLKGGLGVQYALSPAMQVRAEWERYRVTDGLGNNNGVNAVTVGLVFPFGRTPKSAPLAQAEPAYMAPMVVENLPPPAAAPAPAPMPEVAAAVAPQVRRVSFSAESLFSFDDASIGPEGQVALDTFARELAGANYDQITVEGHTDRLGAASYNEALSIKRAEAVKAYLVNVAKLDADKVMASGKGETAPVTAAADCPTKKGHASLVACLRPDRRVEIEVVGTTR